MKEKETLHPAIHDLKADLDKGKLTRREFLRYSTLLGMSAFAATQMAGLGLPKKVLLPSLCVGEYLRLRGKSKRLPIRPNFHGSHPHRWDVRSPNTLPLPTAKTSPTRIC